MRIAVVGCGFLGSELIEELCKASFSLDIPLEMRVIDYDNWEKRNSANQNVPLSVAELGDYKVNHAASICKAYQIPCIPLPLMLTDNSIQELLGNTELLFDATDNVSTRQRLWGIGKTTQPCIHLGISRNGEGRVEWSSPEFDNFSLAPTKLVFVSGHQDDVKEPPCDLFTHRMTGLLTVQGAVRAFVMFLGKNPWQYLEGLEIVGAMTTWGVDIENGLSLRLEPEDLTKEGTLPVLQLNHEEMPRGD